MLIWMIGLLAFIAVVAGITVAVRTNRAMITAWLTAHNRELVYGVGLVGGLMLLGLLVFFHPIAVFAVAIVVVIAVAVIRDWGVIGPFLRAHWFRIFAPFVIVGFGLWLISTLGALPSQTLLLWSIVATIIVAMIVFWNAMWRLIGTSWRPILVVVTILILIVAFTRATIPIQSAVTGWWNQVTQTGQSTGGGNSSPLSRPSFEALTRQRTEAEVANCLRQLANTPPYISPESERAKMACQ